MASYNSSVTRFTSRADVGAIERYQTVLATPNAQFVTAIYFATAVEEPIFTEVVLEYGHPFISAYIVTPSLTYNRASYGAISNPYRYLIFTPSQHDSMQPMNSFIANATESIHSFPAWKGDILVLKTKVSDGEVIDAEPDDLYECEEYLLEAIGNGIVD